MSGSNHHFNSSTLRGHYSNPRQQAWSFLMTIGAKALVIEEQMYQYEQNQLHNSANVSPTPSMDESSGTDTNIDRVSMNSTSTLSVQRYSIERQRGINEEAEFRQKMLQQERIRSIRRRILEKGTLLVYKRGRNQKMRLIEITIVHEKKKETYIVWKSKLNRLKKVDIDHTTHVQILKNNEVEIEVATSSSSSSQFHTQHHHNDHNNNSSNGDGNREEASATPHLNGNRRPSSHGRNSHSHQDYIDHLTHQHHNNDNTDNRLGVGGVGGTGSSSQTTGSMLTSSSERTNTTHQTNNPSTSTTTQHLSYNYQTSSQTTTTTNRSHASVSERPIPTSTTTTTMPFVRFKNKHRHLDLQFQSQVELEAFLLVLQKFTSFELELNSLPISPLTNLTL